MSDPTTGHDPARPTGQPEPQDSQDPQVPQDAQDTQDTQDAGQPTERIDPVQPDHPTEPIGTGGPETSPTPDEPGTAANGAPRADARTQAASWPDEPASTGHPAAGYPGTSYPGTWDVPDATAAPLPEPAEPRGVPLGTLVFGLVVVALGLLILVSVLYDITLSGSAVAIALFLGAGLVLVIGGLVAARRSSGTNRPGA